MGRRNYLLPEVTCSNAVADSEAVDYRGWVAGMVYMPSGANHVLLTLWVAPTPGGTYVALEDVAGNPVTMVVAASKGVPIRPEAFGAGAIKFVGDNGTDDNVIITLEE